MKILERQYRLEKDFSTQVFEYLSEIYSSFIVKTTNPEKRKFQIALNKFFEEKNSMKQKLISFSSLIALYIDVHGTPRQSIDDPYNKNLLLKYINFLASELINPKHVDFRKNKHKYSKFTTTQQNIEIAKKNRKTKKNCEEKSSVSN